jgi:peptidoglycan/xylan/chitin deacetylase (PgdA/CDA1 family)
MIRWICICLAVVVLATSCSTLISPRESWGLEPNQIALTFDDGPNGRGGVTEGVLDVLEAHGIKGTFCVVGQEVEKEPAIVRRIAAGGHRLVNHSFSHPMPLSLSEADWTRELDRTDAVIAAALGRPGYRTAAFRPPYLLSGGAVERIAAVRGLQPVGVSVFSILTVDSEFSPANGKEMVKFYKSALESHHGGVIVLHDGIYRGRDIGTEEAIRPDSSANRSWVPQALEELIQYFSAKGYTFVLLPGSNS